MNPLLTHPALGRIVGEVSAAMNQLDQSINDPMGAGLSFGERADLFYPPARNRVVVILRRERATAAQLDEAIVARTSGKWLFVNFSSVVDFVTNAGQLPDLSDPERFLE